MTSKDTAIIIIYDKQLKLIHHFVVSWISWPHIEKTRNVFSEAFNATAHFVSDGFLFLLFLLQTLSANSRNHFRFTIIETGVGANV